jgi:hypothetical protein
MRLIRLRFPRFFLTASRMSCSISAYVLTEVYIHLHLDDALFVGREVRGYVLECHKGRRRHEELAED